MQPNVQILEATQAHAEEVAANMRREDRLECVRFGAQPRFAAMFSWNSAVMRRAALIDGRVAAIWGVGGSPLSVKGRPWLLTTPVIEAAGSFLIAGVYREQVGDMLKLFPILENFVDSSYNSAIRLLKVSGFRVHNPEPIGRRGALFSRFDMGAS